MSLSEQNKKMYGVELDNEFWLPRRNGFLSHNGGRQDVDGIKDTHWDAS